MTQYAFILSSGRTGTQFLAHYFNENFADVLALHEPKPSYTFKVLSNLYADDLFPRGAILPLFRLARQPVWARSRHKYYIESNTFIYGFIDVLFELHESTQVFHIIRDPRDYVRSELNNDAWRGKKWLVSHIVPYWRPRVRYLLQPLGIRATPVNVFAAIWRHVNTVLLERGQAQPRYHRFLFEDVFTPPYVGLQHLCETMNLDYPGGDEKLGPTRKMNVGTGSDLGKWPQWSATQCREVDIICGDLMRQFGYGLEPEWLARLPG